MLAAPNNEDRANWARASLEAFQGAKGESENLNRLHPDDHEDAVSDLLADLLHYARRAGFDPENLVARAVNNFEAEERGE